MCVRLGEPSFLFFAALPLQVKVGGFHQPSEPLTVSVRWGPHWGGSDDATERPVRCLPFPALRDFGADSWSGQWVCFLTLPGQAWRALMPSLGISARWVGAEWRCLRQLVPPLLHSCTAYPGHVPSTGPTTVDVDPGTWQMWCLQGFSTIGLLFPPFHTALGEKVSMCDHTLGLGSSAPSPHKLFGILLPGRFVSSPPLIYLYQHDAQFSRSAGSIFGY